jgi:diguanylate cyclase (GGDEF)-like protein
MNDSSVSRPLPEVILCVDDDAALLLALRTFLTEELGNDCLIEIAESAQEALELCEELQQQGREIGVAITDFIMPGMRGDEFLKRLHQLSPRTMKIMLSGQSDLQSVIRSIDEAHLYRFLEKPFNNADMMLTVKTALLAYRQSRILDRQNIELKRVNVELEGLVAQRTAELVAKNHELIEKNLQLERLSVTDRLTGLFNRLKLDQVLDDEMNRHQRYASTFSVLLLDIDKFKAVNDTWGHTVGDEVLVSFARLLTAETRDVDIVGRWGGEEFLIVCIDTDRDGALAVAEKLRAAIAAHEFPTIGRKTASIGVACIRKGDTITDLIARADTALYRAKEAGRNRVDYEA